MLCNAAGLKFFVPIPIIAFPAVYLHFNVPFSCLEGANPNKQEYPVTFLVKCKFQS